MDPKTAIAEYRQAQWVKVIQERNSSGLSVKAYCETAGIHENTYYYRLKRLREAACDELSTIQGRQQSLAQPVFAEVRVPERPVQSSSVNIHQSQVCFEANGTKITAGSEYPIDKLMRLLKAVSR